MTANHRFQSPAIRHGRARLQAGGVSILTAVGLPVIIGVLALAIDVSFALADKNIMQGVADNAARAAARVKAMSGSTEAMYKAEAAGVVAAHGTSYAIEYVGQPQSGNYTMTTNAVEVRLTKTSYPFFGGVVNLVAGQSKVRAVAARDYLPCMMALRSTDSSGSTGSNSGITVSGSGTDLKALCAIYSNKTDPTTSVVINAGKLGGNALFMVGGTSDSERTGLNIPASRVYSNSQSLPNPFEARMSEMLTVPSGTPTYNFDTQCATVYSAATNSGYNGSTLFLRPGRYSVLTGGGSNNSLAVNSSTKCKTGMQTTTTTCNSAGKNCTTTTSDVVTAPQKIVLNSGIYYFDGGVDINLGSLEIVGNNVTLVMLSNSSSIQMNGGLLTLSAPSADPIYSGIVMVSNTTGNTKFVSSTSNIDISGNVVMPNSDMTLTGSVGSNTGSDSGKCMTLIAGGFKIAGLSGSLSGGCTSDNANFSNTRTWDLSE